eukprot:CAMPEP_0195135080 /NCGR_PEP_ID=MMETSP0448-20130528/151842_1 /TAXON_ID=66468 /ORGANISM="Heterocapsa triquestra, Strain CCMP 448" /LENGTH=47 /DNA_ID= /DNA_START= /DNA_END= /DNA_ORIENTATION=
MTPRPARSEASTNANTGRKNAQVPSPPSPAAAACCHLPMGKEQHSKT